MTIFTSILQKMTEKCFKKCVGKPGTVLDSSEQVSVYLPDLQGVLYKKALAVQFERLVSIPYCYSALESLSEMYRNVHGSVYGFLEFSFEDLWAEVAARAFKYVE